MIRKHELMMFLLTLIAAVFVLGMPLRAEEKPAATDAAPATESAGAESSSANSGMQREYARLAQMLNSTKFGDQREAAEALLRVRPSDVTNADTKKLIARGYRSLAMEGHGSQDEAIRGLLIWGGKYSVPVLIDLMDKEKVHISEELFAALGQLKDPKGAEAVARHLGNFFNHDAAVSSLRRMGPAAEDALIKAAPSGDEKVSLAAVQLLGEVGTDKSSQLLQKASQAKNRDVKQAAREAMMQIRDRQKNGAVAGAAPGEDANSPFAEGAGPAVDIRPGANDRLADRPSRRGGGEFGGGKQGGIGEPGEDSEEMAADLNEGDWSQVNALLPGDPAGEGAPADPAKEAIDPSWKPQPVRLADQPSRQEQPAALAIAGGNSAVAVVLYSDPFQKSFSRLEYLSLQKRKSLGSTNVPGGVTSCSLSPSGKRLLIVSSEGFHNRKVRLEVWSLESGKPAQQTTWWPYATGDIWQNEMQWADWIDEDQLLTVNSEGKLVLWRMEGKQSQAVYQIDGDRGTVPSLSPSRTQLAMSTPRGVEIYRATDGELLARMAELRPAYGRVAFNAAGDRLACVSGKQVCIWNSTTGKLERDFDCGSLVNRGDVIWLGNDHLLVGGSDVIDLQRRLVLWHYELPSRQLHQYFGGREWILMESNNLSGLVPAQLLGKEELAVAQGINADEILAVKPGAKMTLEVNIGGEEQAKAEAALRTALEQNGMEVASDQPLKLRAQVVTGKTETQEYSRSIFDRNTESATVTEKSYEVEILLDGESLWKQTTMMQSGRAPMHVFMQKGESVQQAVDRENAQRGGNFRFSVNLPRYVVQPKYAGPLGKSTVSLGR